MAQQPLLLLQPPQIWMLLPETRGKLAKRELRKASKAAKAALEAELPAPKPKKSERKALSKADKEKNKAEAEAAQLEADRSAAQACIALMTVALRACTPLVHY